MTYSIIADSCCDITPELEQELAVSIVPLTMRLGDKEFIDDDTLDLGRFMEEMKACKQPVGSAAPAPYLYEQAMEKAGDSFVVTLSSQLSASHANALLAETAAERKGKGETYVFDSKSASAGETLIAIKLHELIQKGMERSQIIQSVNAFITHMKTYFVLECYDNLLKNGRLSKIKGKLASILNIKLLMGSDGHGNMALFEKVRGTAHMVNALLASISNSGRSTEGENIVISHCNHPALAERLAGAIREQFHFKKIYVVPTGGLSSLYADDKGIVMAF